MLSPPENPVQDGTVSEQVASSRGEVPGGVGAGAGAASRAEASGLAPQPLPRRALSESLETNVLAALRRGHSFDDVAGSQVPLDHVYSPHGAQRFRAPPEDQVQVSWARGAGGPERRRRNVIQLRFQGTGESPGWGVVVDMVLSMGFRVLDLFSVIHPHNSTEYDVSFMTPLGMELFLIKTLSS